MKNNKRCFSNSCKNSKENKWFWNNNFNNSNKEMNDIMKIVQVLEDSDIL